MKLRSHSSTAVVDFLTLPFQAQAGLSRDGGRFEASRPWSVLKFGKHRLGPGWWTFDLEGEADQSAVEVRLSSPSDPLILLRAGEGGRLLLTRPTSFDVSVQIAAWPGRTTLTILQLKRLGVLQAVKLLIAGAGRVIRRPQGLSIAWHIFQRLRAGQATGIKAVQSNPSSYEASDETPPFEVDFLPQWDCVRHDDVSAYLPKGARLHDRAFDLASQSFSQCPEVQAAYADLVVGKELLPLPSWDRTLAEHSSFISGPVFFRGTNGIHDNPWNQLKSIAERFGDSAVLRIPLPLASRANRVSFAAPKTAPALSRSPRVSIVIPTKYRVDLLEKCLASLDLHTEYPDIEVVVVDNGCVDASFPALIARAGQTLNLSVVEDRGAFNFSRLVNTGVKGSTGDVILLLNDDVEAGDPTWLRRIVDSALEPDVGAVGARLLYPDGTIQHAGVMIWLGGAAGHLWKGASPDDAARNPMIISPGTRLAVTGACIASRRDVYQSIGGFDEGFAVAFNDIDFCLRLRRAGYRTIYRGDAVLTHHESKSRGADDLSLSSRRRLARETALFFQRWRDKVGDDPFGSPAFDLSVQTGKVHPALRSLWPK